jgi:hypothetical protein
MLKETKTQTPDFRPAGVSSELEDRTQRLRAAVRRAGGNLKVSKVSGVPLSTLQGYLSGAPMKLEPAMALARACGMSLDWLVTGGAPISAPVAPTAPAPLFQTVNMDMLAAAIAGATKVFADQQRDPTGRPFAQIVCILYDEAKARLDAGEA